MTLSELFRLTNLINDKTTIVIRKRTTLFGTVRKKGKWYEDQMLDYVLANGATPVADLKYSKVRNRLEVWTDEEE